VRLIGLPNRDFIYRPYSLELSSLGRPIEYDEEAVVGAALRQFWAHGYQGSSVDDLVGTSGLNKHSLYRAFGGKSGLFLRALQRCLSEYADRYLKIFERYEGLTALNAYFDAVMAKPDPRGCFYNRLANCFGEAIRQGQRAGSFRSDLDSRGTTRWLVRAVQGLGVSIRLGDRELPDARSILALLVRYTDDRSSDEERPR
jgi:TetR/AcrR family transcriptional repressor of nem operon